MNCFELSDFKEQPSLLRELRKIADTLIFGTYSTDKGTKSQLQYCSIKDTYHTELPEIKQLISRFNNKLSITQMLFIKFDCNQGIFPHIDDNTARSSCVTWAISPEISEFAPVLYYGVDDEVTETVYYTSRPLLLNTRTVHAVKNNNNIRLTFQICFSNPITELYTMYTNNEFFSNDI